MEVVMRVRLEHVRAAEPKNIYYAARTCWWTHDPAHLSKLPDGLPCDPRGSVLFMTGDIEGFLTAAENNPQYYGKHGLRAFTAAHHSNCYLDHLNPRSWSSESWTEYNDALDRFDEALKRILAAIKKTGKGD